MMHGQRNIKYWLCSCPAATAKLAKQYRQFIDKNFKLYLIICSPGVWGFKGHFQQAVSHFGTILYINFTAKSMAFIRSIPFKFWNQTVYF